MHLKKSEVLRLQFNIDLVCCFDYNDMSLWRSLNFKKRPLFGPFSFIMTCHYSILKTSIRYIMTCHYTRVLHYNDMSLLASNYVNL